MPDEKTTENKPKNTKMPVGKLVKKVSSDILLIVITVIALCILGYFISAYIRVEEIGGGIGTTAGLAERAKDGKAAGLSAENTEVNIANKVQTMGKLEVLSASVIMHDLLEISDKYKTLLAFYGDITFTVDLYNAEITPDGNIREVLLPMPEADLRIDDKKSEQLDFTLSIAGRAVTRTDILLQ